MADLATATSVGQQLKILERRIDNKPNGALKYGGTWRATNSSQLISGDTDTLLLLNTVVGTAPAGITNNNNGTWTINKAGVWEFNLIYVIFLYTNGRPHFFQKWINRGTVSVGECQSSYVDAYRDRGSATATGVQCAAGDVISCYGRWTNTAIAGIQYNADNPTLTTSFTANWVRPL